MKTIVSIPEAKLLLASLRSVGYSEEAAVADIIDNCISANANEIEISFSWDNKTIIIRDNGIGMSQKELYENMRIGSSNPDSKRDTNDLGRFGMGMKTAAFSLGKRLTVISKKDGILCNATWDLDQISEIGWQLIVVDDNQLIIPEELNKSENGTAVIIENLDRIIDTNDLVKAKKHFYSVVRRVEKHIGLVFHRFMTEDSLIIKINDNIIKPWDPFITDNKATQELPEEFILSDDGEKEVLIQPFVLPHKTKFDSDTDYQNAGGPKGWNYHQGVYLYRNRRLIICGTWFDFIKKEPAYNLARIRVDISSDSDADWKIDIKKSSAALPIYARDSLESIIENTTERSAKVYNSRGVYSKSGVSSPNLNYVWEQRKRNGKYSFYINKKHKLLEDIRKQLDDNGKTSLNAYLSLVENFAPFMQSGITDTIQTAKPTETSLETEVQIVEIKEFIELFIKSGFTKKEIQDTLLDMPTYRHLKDIIVKLVEEI